MNKFIVVNGITFERIDESVSRDSDTPPRSQNPFNKDQSSLVKSFFIEFPYSEIDTGKVKGGFRVRLYAKYPTVLKHLLRKALVYGINSVEYYILFFTLEKIFFNKIIRTKDLILIIGIISLIGAKFRISSNPRNRSQKLGPDLKSYKNVRISNQVYDNLFEALNKHLNLPSSYNDEYWSFSEIYLERPDARPELYIGQGYKDKGSLKPDHKKSEFDRFYEPKWENLNWIEFINSFDEFLQLREL